MRLYWLDRDGNPPPEKASFYFRPFSSKTEIFPCEHLLVLPKKTRVKTVKKTFFPDKTQWIESVTYALEQIEKGDVQKVVLARTALLELNSSPDPFAILASLKERGENAFTFCLEKENEAFLGATPERLFKRVGRNIFSEALAGTRGRGKTAQEDLALELELLKSDKDAREHRFVQNYIQNKLKPLCEKKLEFSPISVSKTKNVQHLYQKCEGTLFEKVTDETILDELHPTPALCGEPKEKAFSLIQKLEPFERGLYGGAIGWSTENESEWIVGIRSCLLKANRAILFSAAGIVKGSDPEKEWEELNQKIELYETILDY